MEKYTEILDKYKYKYIDDTLIKILDCNDIIGEPLLNKILDIDIIYTLDKITLDKIDDKLKYEKILIRFIPIIIKKLNNKPNTRIEELEKKIDEIKEMIYYMPNGIGYNEAKNNFDLLKN